MSFGQESHMSFLRITYVKFPILHMWLETHVSFSTITYVFWWRITYVFFENHICEIPNFTYVIRNTYVIHNHICLFSNHICLFFVRDGAFLQVVLLCRTIYMYPLFHAAFTYHIKEIWTCVILLCSTIYVSCRHYIAYKVNMNLCVIGIPKAMWPFYM